MSLFGKRASIDESGEARSHRLALIDDLTFEVVPLKSLTGAIEHLPEGARVSVTCSPVKGIDETLKIAEDLLARGFVPIPHIAARSVRDTSHTAEIASRLRQAGINKAFVVGGDVENHGAYLGAVEFMRDLLEQDHGLQTIGFAAYPDGHALLAPEVVSAALRDKQTMLAEAGVDAYCSTQMCFDPNTIAKWLRSVREAGIELPVHLGLAGVVDRAKLVNMGARLGVGASLRYLKKNRAAVTKLMTVVHYDPNDLLAPLSDDMFEFGVKGLHVFTFNQVEATNNWRLQALRG